MGWRTKMFELCGINNQIALRIFLMPFEVGTLSELKFDSRTYLKNLQLDLNLI
jgi:hypothetical protein